MVILHGPCSDTVSFLFSLCILPGEIKLAGDRGFSSPAPSSSAAAPPARAAPQSSGAVARTSGAVARTSGAAASTSGAASLTSGAATPASGAATPASGAASPTSVEAAPTSGEAAQESGTAAPTSGAAASSPVVVPRDDDSAPQRNQKLSWKNEELRHQLYEGNKCFAPSLATQCLSYTNVVDLVDQWANINNPDYEWISADEKAKVEEKHEQMMASIFMKINSKRIGVNNKINDATRSDIVCVCVCVRVCVMGRTSCCEDVESDMFRRRLLSVVSRPLGAMACF